ncbi:Ankyrin repeat and SOCS box protein 3 [Phytophthora ramorum]|uniref:Ankyrin repeat and SOCS box protein 3 n=1 Tax=Phytophthora ramorum TaxID=164328 RepID=UPI0030A597FE|nr:Ankyrin repeat and SOCS box protein 3 [Phytophthora ramorum]
MWAKTITDFVRANDEAGVLQCLKDGGDVNERRSKNYTPLINAAYYNKCMMIKLLLDNGADIEAVDKSGLSALRTAIYYGKQEAAVLLAQCGSDANKVTYQQTTALYAAVQQGQAVVVKALLASGADPRVACGSSDYTPLINAAYYGNCDMIELLLDNGADIDAVDRSGLSALRTAIYYRRDEAALLLAQRGAEANKVAYQKTTALYAAVEIGHASAARALLMNGANPLEVCGNNKSVMDLATKGEIWTTLKIFTDLDTALSSRTCPAVRTVLTNLLAKDPSREDVLKAYKNIRDERSSALGDWLHGLTEIAEEFQIGMLEYALRSGSSEFVDEVCEAVGKPNWVSTTPLNPDGHTALHVAASLGDESVVSLLLDKYECDSIVVDSQGKTASQLVSEDTNQAQTRLILEEHEKKTKFMDLTNRMLRQDEVELPELLKLSCNMTSIYDLRLVFHLAYRALTDAELKQLIEEAFEQAVRMKLMFDNSASVFFKEVLRECKRRKLISQRRKDYWKSEAFKVNVENSEFVRKIQSSIAQLENRVSVTERNVVALNTSLNSLRTALQEKARLEGDRKRRQFLIKMVTSGLMLCGGALLGEALSSVFDSCDSAEELLAKLTESDVTGFVHKDFGNVVCKQATQTFHCQIEAVLENACIDKVEFKALLGAVVALEAADAAETTEMTRRFNDPGHPSVPIVESAASPMVWLGLPCPTRGCQRPESSSSLENILDDYVRLFEERLIVDVAASTFSTASKNAAIQLRDLENMFTYASPKTVAILFHQYDEDRSGTIDAKELLSIVRHINFMHGVCDSCSMPVSRNDTAFQCSMCDAYLLCVRCYPDRSTIHPRHCNKFQPADDLARIAAEKSGFPQHIGSILQQHVNDIFAEIDTDGDGELSFEEITSYFSKCGMALDFVNFALSFDLKRDGRISRREALFVLTGLEMVRGCDECGKTSFVGDEDMLSCVECTEYYDICTSCRNKGQSSHPHDRFEVAKPFPLHCFGLYYEHTTNGVWHIAVGDSELWEMYKPFVGDRVGETAKLGLVPVQHSP